MWEPVEPPPVVEQAAAAFQIHHGGPDQAPGALRDLLKARVDAAPPGSEIIWVTYYFRDLDLAGSLLAAHRRGVAVRVLMDARPRRRDANAAVIARLRELGGGLRLHRPLFKGPRLHTKIYAFSGPQPEVFLGSFNPSGNEPEDPDVVAEIGDQDRGYNLLVSFREPSAARTLTDEARRVWRGDGLSRFSRAHNRPVKVSGATVYFFPRMRPDVVERALDELGRGDRVRAAVSHIGGGRFAEAITSASQRGADVSIVVHDTERRAPDEVVSRLAGAGVSIRRYCDPERLPMHAKFVLVERAGRTTAWFGSLNYNLNSYMLNQEVLARTADAAVVRNLSRRFETIALRAERLGWACPTPWPKTVHAMNAPPAAGGR